MKKDATNIVIGAAALTTLISLASTFSISSKNKQSKAEILALQEQIVRMEASIPNASAESQIVYLTETGDTNDLTVLKSQLAETEAKLESIQSNTNRPPRQRVSWEDRIAKMKAEDPEGYAEMVKKREERQQQMKYNLAERTATFMDLNTSLMNEEELANHELLVSKMARVWELTALLDDPETPPDRETMREMFTQMNEVRPLLRDERTVMFKQLGNDLGYTGEEAENFASHVEEIINTTSIQMPRGGSRGGRGDGGGNGDGGRGR